MNAAIQTQSEIQVTDLRPTPDDIRRDTLIGLARSPKRLSSKYFYDARGSQLFEAITREPEYYLTRTEIALMEARIGEIADAIGANAHVVEYGSGSGLKTRLLLEALADPVAYTPIEISRSALVGSVERLSEEFPAIEMLPVCADFTKPVALPMPARTAQHTLVFFPGSTLGNFTDAEAVILLRAMRETLCAHGSPEQGEALIGIDLQKDPALIEAAYNDAAGVTAEFTLNLLARLNREIGSNFDLHAFRHRAFYDAIEGRIETFLISQREQVVTIGVQQFSFAKDEPMQVEYSRKYTDAGFAALATQAGLAVSKAWDDPRHWFGVRLLHPID
ncbi:MAG: L-histidine N(alpha)-methyltransferase [Dokdonella sp.]